MRRVAAQLFIAQYPVKEAVGSVKPLSIGSLGAVPRCATIWLDGVRGRRGGLKNHIRWFDSISNHHIGLVLDGFESASYKRVHTVQLCRGLPIYQRSLNLGGTGA